MNNKTLTRRDTETLDDFLIRLGSLKDAGILDLTWPEISDIMNAEITDEQKRFTGESTWRKRYRRQLYARSINHNDPSIFSRINNIDDVVTPRESIQKRSNENIEKPEIVNTVDEKTLAGEKIKVQVRDERSALNRRIRNDARNDALMELFRSTIARYSAVPVRKVTRDDPCMLCENRAVYAMLSDIHYGIAYNSSAGKYNSSIAYDRVMRYAYAIADVGELHNISTCYISLLGDMISGNIHNVIRVENRENVVQQVVGVSELVAEFLYELSGKFQEVHVNAVSGNHSRLDLNSDDALRGDKLDELIPWYCKTKLENCSNIIWHDNTIDATIGDFDIFGVHYVSVHGDYDNNLQKSVMQIERVTRQPIDYIIAGHMHVPDLRLENTGFIRNGSVCGSGDEYTMKKRLFGYPCQVCLVVDETGLREFIPIAL